MKTAQFTPRFNTSGAQFVPSWLEESAAVELTGDNVTQTNTSSSGAIILPVILAGDNVTQTNSSTTGAISVPVILTGDNVTQTNESSTGSISQTISYTLPNRCFAIRNVSATLNVIDKSPKLTIRSACHAH